MKLLLDIEERTVDPAVGDMQLAGVDVTAVMPGPGPPVVDITQLNILSVDDSVKEERKREETRGGERKNDQEMRNKSSDCALFAGGFC